MRHFNLLLMTLAFASCKQKVGGPCDYQEVAYNVTVSELVESDGELAFVDFAALDGTPVSRLRFTTEDLSTYGLDFRALKDAGEELKLTIEEITKGSCTPYILIDLKTK